MPITTDLATLIGQVRAEIGDDDATAGKGKKPDGTNIADELIQVWLDRAALMSSDTTRQVFLAAASACEALGRWWSNAADVETSTRREYYSVVATAWDNRAKTIRQRLVGGLRVRPLGRASNISTSEYGARSG